MRILRYLHTLAILLQNYFYIFIFVLEYFIFISLKFLIPYLILFEII